MKEKKCKELKMPTLTRAAVEEGVVPGGGLLL